MCRFALYLGPPIAVSTLVTEPTHSILQQSFEARERDEDPLNGDGFGIAWYVPEITPEPALFRSPLPAWNDPNLLHLARVTQSRCILAHVRAATPGVPVTVFNCHPFAHGRHAFMHNGAIGDFARLQRPLQQGLSDEAWSLIRGSTDSEHLFAGFVDQLAALPDGEDAAQRMAQALDTGVRRLEEQAADLGLSEPSFLNAAVTDGRVAVVTRYATPPYTPASLYLHTGALYTCAGGVCRMLAPGSERGAVLVCSEPLSSDPGWQPVPPQHLVVVGADGTVDVRPLAAAGVRSAA